MECYLRVKKWVIINKKNHLRDIVKLDMKSQLWEKASQLQRQMKLQLGKIALQLRDVKSQMPDKSQ